MCKKSFQITAWALKKKKSTNKKLTQTPTLCFSFCFSLFNLILIENLVHWQMMECPAWEGQWIASVFAGILRLFTLHCLSCCCTRTDCKETHTKPTLCKGFFFLVLKKITSLKPETWAVWKYFLLFLCANYIPLIQVHDWNMIYLNYQEPEQSWLMPVFISFLKSIVQLGWCVFHSTFATTAE